MDSKETSNITKTECQAWGGEWTSNNYTPMSCSSTGPTLATGDDFADYGAPTHTGFAYGVSPNVTSVKFFTWSEANGQDDITTQDGIQDQNNPGTWYYYAYIETQHPTTAADRKIIFHAYLYSDAATTGAFCGEHIFTVKI